MTFSAAWASLWWAGVQVILVIADYRVITERDTAAHVRDHVYGPVLDYLAAGLDPERTLIFTHSAVPALNQLLLPFLRRSARYARPWGCRTSRTT